VEWSGHGIRRRIRLARSLVEQGRLACDLVESAIRQDWTMVKWE
jgi:hypothetical protein